MRNIATFPLLSGNLSLDLVNTEVVRRGKRHNLLQTELDLRDWLYVMQEAVPFFEAAKHDLDEQLATIYDELLPMRATLRAQFEAIVDNEMINDSFIALLEETIARAPITYKLQDGQLVATPIGTIANQLLTMIALDALTLIADGKLQRLKRCANPDCVLLFMDESGRRKWCSMKICGNRQKVASFQQRKHDM